MIDVFCLSQSEMMTQVQECFNCHMLKLFCNILFTLCNSITFCVLGSAIYNVPLMATRWQQHTVFITSGSPHCVFLLHPVEGQYKQNETLFVRQ